MILPSDSTTFSYTICNVINGDFYCSTRPRGGGGHRLLMVIMCMCYLCVLNWMICHIPSLGPNLLRIMVAKDTPCFVSVSILMYSVSDNSVFP